MTRERRRYRTDAALWLIVSLAVFGLLSFVELIPTEQGRAVSIFELGDAFLRQGNGGRLLLLSGAAVLAGSIFIGWIVQAAAVVISARFKRPGQSGSS